MIHMRPFNKFEENNLKYLVNKQIEYATIQITATGLKKSILDATVPVRTYFLENHIHNFEEQPQGQEHKRKIKTIILNDFKPFETVTSFYRPNTKKGDPRIWPSGLNNYTKPDDIFAIIAHEGILYIINLSSISIEFSYNQCTENPIRQLIDSIHGQANSASSELLGLIREKMSDWLPSEIMADTGIGRTVETVLGIPMNSSKLGDYKGIELKSKREKSNVRNTLFTQAPNWDLSRLKNAKSIVDKYGYVPIGYNHKTLHVTLAALKPNAQGLGLNVEEEKNWLEANEYKLEINDKGLYDKICNVSVWQLVDLHQRLLTKHHETFWIDVATRKDNNTEYFRVSSIEHTKNPIVSQFDLLLGQGKITVDFLLGRNSGGDTYSFKLNPKSRSLLFPQSDTYFFNSLFD